MVSVIPQIQQNPPKSLENSVRTCSFPFYFSEKSLSAEQIVVLAVGQLLLNPADHPRKGKAEKEKIILKSQNISFSILEKE